ncbi:prenyltransferase [Candidatus Halobonum tyrrellensis]|uniref:Prenyltransferase n=1 Tax=Candidatus Halobonum tyrrellensis G22 TaxID=1324957 RepID=V4HLZ1_9EURY|nr:prenyltransferase [Candidatus Halobonum tyrrellensis]ESP88939.1 prenyltransferase [Candidatus Halobonum tyrrellensis G22]
MSGDRPTASAAGARDGPRARLRSLVTLSRPRFWLYLAGPVLVGVAFGARTVGDLVTPSTAGLFAYFLLPANVFLYGVNDVFDRDIDAVNPKKGGGREARYEGDPLVPAAVVASALLGLGLFAVTPRATWPYLGGFLLLGAAYSAPPRLKTKPPLDSVSNGLYVLPGAAAFALVSGAHPPTAALVGGWLWSMGMHTFSAIPDVEPDRAAGVETTATLLGETRTYAYCGACWLAAVAAFAAVDPRLALPLAVYPPVAAAVPLSGVSVHRAYWWFPALNTLVGTLLTLGALWRFPALRAVVA